MQCSAVDCSARLDSASHANGREQLVRPAGDEERVACGVGVGDVLSRVPRAHLRVPVPAAAARVARRQRAHPVCVRTPCLHHSGAPPLLLRVHRARRHARGARDARPVHRGRRRPLLAHRRPPRALPGPPLAPLLPPGAHPLEGWFASSLYCPVLSCTSTSSSPARAGTVPVQYFTCKQSIGEQVRRSRTGRWWSSAPSDCWRSRAHCASDCCSRRAARCSCSSRWWARASGTSRG